MAFKAQLARFVTKTNAYVASTRWGYWHRLDGSGHPKTRPGSSFLTEIRAGLATFFAMAYIISVNASIASDSGGTCVCVGTTDDPTCDADIDYMNCVEAVKQDLVTGTAAIAALTTFCMGLFANIPIGLAPGMGLNSYFAYQVVGYHGSGRISYRVALTAVFVEGWIFIALSILGIRQWLARTIPASIKMATGAGIGLYLTLIGLYGSAGLGVVNGATETPLEIWGCDSRYSTDDCEHHIMTSRTMWLGIFCGGFVTVFLMLYRVKGAVIAGIMLVSIISWPRTTDVTYFPYDDTGDTRFDFFKKVVTFHKMDKILVAQDWNVSAAGGQFWLALITFLYVDILDTTGTLYSMAKYAGVMDPVTGDFEGSAIAYIVDAGGIVIGSLFGCPPVTAFIESGAGISEGGATGITAMVTGFCFFIAVFFAPIFASIPPWATGSTLIIVGAMMMRSVKDINWRYAGDAIPAFLTIAVMPFTYSISYGLIAGLVSYIVLNTVAWAIMKISNGRVVPENWEHRDVWSWRSATYEENTKYGSFFMFIPPWFARLVHGEKHFWREPEVAPVSAVTIGNDDELVQSTTDYSRDNESAEKNEKL
ncbi:MFS transporter AGZA family xanthine/uracil permease, partial [Dipodascopsis tothii]|uniref:MFS transporter AGZA family xanthine/uracil permease n=1 Tax=Dipodascopsis tothii TaxID=44089 RepID=UPI0034CD3021